MLVSFYYFTTNKVSKSNDGLSMYWTAVDLESRLQTFVMDTDVAMPESGGQDAGCLKYYMGAVYDF
jgi:hypothetical protein